MDLNFDRMQKKMKEFLSDKRNSALVKLGFYIVLMIVAVVFARASYQASVEDGKTKVDKKGNLSTEETIKSFKDYSNYIATYKITNHVNNKDQIFTYTYVQKTILKVGEESYFVNEDGSLTNTLGEELPVPSFKFNFWCLNPKTLSDLFILSEEDYVKNYTVGNKTEVGYKISLQDFENNFDAHKLPVKDASLLADKDIEFIVTIFDSKVIGVEVDLTPYYNLLTNTNSGYVLHISYDKK